MTQVITDKPSKNAVLNQIDFGSFYKNYVPSLTIGSNKQAKGCCPFRNRHFIRGREKK